MTAQTQAQRNASYRARQREKIERYEAALREIAVCHPTWIADNPQWAVDLAVDALDPPALHIEV